MEPPTSDPPSTTTTSSTIPTSPASSLPPEAIALATRFFNAARTGDLPILQQAIPAGLPVNLTNDKGDTLLMLSTYHTHPPLVRYLLDHHADPNTLNERGQSPLAGAVFKAAGAAAAGGDGGGGGAADEIVEMLLEAGADVDRGRPSARESVGMFGVERWRGRICGGGG
ncbi:MAG: hypothetical protein Q9182_000989 [Xanthomendoza sp. 2 TL-2023]